MSSHCPRRRLKLAEDVVELMSKSKMWLRVQLVAMVLVLDSCQWVLLTQMLLSGLPFSFLALCGLQDVDVVKMRSKTMLEALP